MARVPLVAADDPDAIRQGVFDSFTKEKREPIDLYRALANAPDVLLAYRALPQSLRHGAKTPRALRELAILRVARLTGSAYEWSHHRPMALAAGITPAQVAAVAHWRGSDCFDEDERAVLAAVDGIHAIDLPEQAYTALTERLGTEGAIEIVVTVSQYEATARILQALGVEVETAYQPGLADWEEPDAAPPATGTRVTAPPVTGDDDGEMNTTQELSHLAHENITSEEYRTIAGHILSGVSVITTSDAGTWYGTTVSSITSLSLDPPMILVCVNRTSATCEAVTRTGRFTANILADAGGEDAARRFARKGDDKFAGLENTATTAVGHPILPESLAWIEAEVENSMQGGTHTIFAARVIRAGTRSGAPLAYYRGGFGQFAA